MHHGGVSGPLRVDDVADDASRRRRADRDARRADAEPGVAGRRDDGAAGAADACGGARSGRGASSITPRSTARRAVRRACRSGRIRTSGCRRSPGCSTARSCTATASARSSRSARAAQPDVSRARRGPRRGDAAATTAAALHGVQLWVAQPERTRHGAAGVRAPCRAALGRLADGTATVIVGALMGVESPARRDTDRSASIWRCGRDAPSSLSSRRTSTPSSSSPATAAIDDRVVPADQLGYLGSGRDRRSRSRSPTPTRALVVGGEPFEARPLMWWNFVARDREEIDAAYATGSRAASASAR